MASERTSSTSTGRNVMIAAIVAVFGVALALALAGGDGPAPGDFDLAAVSEPAVEEAAAGTAPVATGDSALDDTQVSVPAEGQPTVISFLAHWCPHCNREVPVVMDWVEGGGLPDGVELRAVASGITETAENFPPTTWLDGFGWEVPTILDKGDAIADAYGLEGYPYWVAVDADGQIVQALSGELTPAQLDELVAAAQGR